MENGSRLYDAYLINGRQPKGKSALTGEYTAGKGRKQKVDIRLMYHGSETNMLGSRGGQKKGIEAVRKLEFMVCHAHFLNTTEQYSDLVLPVMFRCLPL